MDPIRHTASLITAACLAPALGLWLVPGSPGIATLAAQPPRADAQSFEVASVRPNNSGDSPGLSGIDTLPGGRVVATNIRLRTLIEFAFGLDSLYERVAGKSSLLDQTFDVMAKAPGDVPRGVFGRVGPVNVMMQHLLADRFKLVVRVEERPQQGYALIRARADGGLGSGIRPADELKCPREVGASPAAGDSRSCKLNSINNELRADGSGMGDFARFLAVQLRRPVVDRTGLPGLYEMRMTYDAFSIAEALGLRVVVSEETRANLPSLFTALEEQLGLKLELQRVQARVLIVEHLEPPSEN